MKTLKKISAVVFLFVSATTFTFAQCCGGGRTSSYGNSNSSYAKQTCSAPHGGTLQDAGKYKIEMVKELISKVDPVKFYVLDKKGKGISGKSISGTAVFKFDDNTTETITLEPTSDSGVSAQLKNKTKPFTCTVTLTVDKKTITAIFGS